jgi:ABC-type transport system involved in cytochrome bd biosynthesis fused ATPase/permease subunit
MTEEKNRNKEVPSSENETKKRSGKASAFSQILNGDFLTKEFVLNNLNYIFFLIALLLLIIAKGYYGKQISVDIDNAQREYDQNAAEYIEVKSKLETVTRRYKLVERLEKRELKETKNATKVIRLKKKKDE